MVFLSKYSWSKFLLFANTDLQQYGNGAPLVENETMGSSHSIPALPEETAQRLRSNIAQFAKIKEVDE